MIDWGERSAICVGRYYYDNGFVAVNLHSWGNKQEKDNSEYSVMMDGSLQDSVCLCSRLLAHLHFCFARKVAEQQFLSLKSFVKRISVIKCVHGGNNIYLESRDRHHTTNHQQR